MDFPIRERILSRTAKIGVMGLGYVGLPLVMEFCRAGYKVVGVDVDERKVQALQNGQSYVLDVPAAELAAFIQSQRFLPTTDFDRLCETDAVSICVPTPLRKSKDPDLSYIVSAADQLQSRLHRGMLVILESTTYPGTTEEVLGAALVEAGLRVGEDIYLCFSPERVDPGNTHHGVRNTPKVIGGVTPACTEVGTLLYSQVMEQVVPVSSAAAAEMVKLLENTFRAVNIGLVNEMALMCQRMGLDIWEVISAAATKPFGFMPFYPGPGIGGHCIPLDPMYLSWKAKMYDFYARFIELASDINGNMPYHVVERIGAMLNLEGKALSNSRILCLGVAYKKDVNDLRESPSIEVIRLLAQEGACVEYSDPHVPSYEEGGLRLESTPLTEVAIRAADCVVLLTAHSAFDYDLIARSARMILDTRNAFVKYSQRNIFRLGAPLPSVSAWRAYKQTLACEVATAAEGTNVTIYDKPMAAEDGEAQK